MTLSPWEQLEPTPPEPRAVRSREVIKLIDGVVLNAVTTEKVSDSLRATPFRHFLLYLSVLSANTPTTVQFKVQFRDQALGPWHTYKQGLFASLYYEDGDTATVVRECFLGDVAGRDFRVVATGTGTSATNTFTISASVEFYS